MNTFILALHLTLTNGVAHVRFSAPVAGTYSLQCSDGLSLWRYISRPETCSNACEISITDADGFALCRFYRVEWRPKPK